MKIALCGLGKMGRAIRDLAQQSGVEVVCPGDAHVLIDFSHKDVVLSHVELACLLQKPIILGTTGWDELIPQAKEMIEKAGIGALYSPNFSLSIAKFAKLLKTAKDLFADYSVVGLEMHHEEKVDAPSGTAKKLSDELGISFNSIRVGHVPGQHEVIFDSPADTIRISHAARSRRGLAEGTLCAAQWILEKKGWFTLDDMVSSDYPLS